MELKNCPQCETELHPPLKSSGRQVCTSCGWSNIKRDSEADSEPQPENLYQPKEIPPTKSKRIGEYSSAILIAILISLVIGQISKPKYEYKIVSPSDISFEESMDKYGSEGWKATSCRRAQDSSTETMSYECMMIRETHLPR
jgi:DNA-binding helix-hairpin-helix protein with protein kinase domain